MVRLIVNRGRIVSKYGASRLIICNKSNIFPFWPWYLLHTIILFFTFHVLLNVLQISTELFLAELSLFIVRTTNVR